MKAGTSVVLATFDKQQNPLFPGVKTAIDQGYKVEGIATQGLTVPVPVRRRRSCKS